MKRLLANQSGGNYKQVISMVEDEKNKKYHDSSQVISLYNEALLSDKKISISAYYTLDFFDDDLPQHLAYVDYGFKIGENKLIFRMNAAWRYGSHGIQLESDYYLTLKKKSYMYFSYGYSFDSEVFPVHRAGYEFYFPLKSGFEASFGARYMRYPDENIFIPTLHFAKYFNKNWLSFRPFYVIQEVGKPFSILANYRRYYGNELKFWGLEFGYGNSPDDRYALTQNNEFFGLTSLRMKIEKNVMIGRTNELRIGAAYADEEYIKGSFRNRYSVDLLFKFRL
jgi:YaiO family outer membrane protein